MKNDTDKVGELASEIAIRGAFLNQGLMMQETSPPQAVVVRVVQRGKRFGKFPACYAVSCCKFQIGGGGSDSGEADSLLELPVGGTPTSNVDGG